MKKESGSTKRQGPPKIESGHRQRSAYAESVQASERQYLGLCSTCNESARCTLVRDPQLPMLFCELFDCSPRIPPDPARPGPTVASNHSQRSLGLCGNCEKRIDCKFEKSEGGVWQCEEYE